MVPTSRLIMLASDPTVAGALVMALTAEDAARVLGDAGEARGFKFDWRSLIPRLKRQSTDRDLDDAALEGVAGGAGGMPVPLAGPWSITAT
ncbi:hypothetical protein WG926_16885 [Tistrella sp. BH-R2-4]|jgi:hypothetical protein|uniref:Uncharacterized protein n=1 Tax=Tistrella arctica TaxID=3133430 RepID=A0ABU9YMH1_9PROT